jgi:hypothetical protein
MTIACIVLTVGVSFFASVFTALLLFGPILHDQELRNGGPFSEGDRVQILAGSHTDLVSEVYQRWQGNTVRVKIDNAAKREFRDIFAGYKLLRVTCDEPPHAPEPAAGPVPNGESSPPVG